MAVALASRSAPARTVVRPSRTVAPGHKRAVTQLQARALAATVPRVSRDISAAFIRLRDSMVHGDTASLKASLPIRYTTPDYNEFEHALTKILTKQYVNVGNMSLAGVKQSLDITLAFDLNERIIPKGVIARQVTGVTDTVKRSINHTIRQGIDDGVHPSVTAKRLFQQASGWAGVGKPITESRAYTIARTESANAFNLGAVLGYRQSGLVQQVEVLDGPNCGWLTHNDPDKANGKMVTLDEAQAHPTAHPNCLRAFAPLVSREAAPPAPQAPAARRSGLPPGVEDTTLRNSDHVLAGDAPLVRRISPYKQTYVQAAYEEMAALQGITVQEAIDQTEGFMQAELAARTLSTRRSIGAAERIIHEGRFKTQFETNKSGGVLSPLGRARRETQMFGYEKDLDPTQRPVYGYMSGDLDARSESSAAGYGQVRFDLTEEARRRTTVVWADSLSSPEYPTPLTNPKAGSYKPHGDLTSPSRVQAGVRTPRPYLEAQIHGGLSMDDVAVVRYTHQLPTPAVQAELQRRGFVGSADRRVWTRSS